MSNIKPHYKITSAAKKRFMLWLFKNDMTLTDFAKKAGCSRQYLTRALNGEITITSTVLEWFKKGGYELL